MARVSKIVTKIFTKTSPELKAAEQKHFQEKVSVLFQKEGNIQEISKPLDENSYKVLKKEYEPLLKKIEDKQSLVDLNKSLAIIAVRAGKDASTYLKAWEKNTSTNANDFKTELQTILEGRIKFLQETGDITKIDTSLDSSKYESNKSICDDLVKTIEKSSLSDAIKTKLSFDLNKCQAISAVRVGKNEDVLKYLLSMRTEDMLSTDKFIVELEPSAGKLSAEYTKTKKNGQIDSNEQPPKYLQLYHYLQETVRTKVAAHLKNGKYVEAYNETQYLREQGNNLKVFKLYLRCIEQNKLLKSLQDKADAYINALNEFKSKISSSQIPEGTETVAGIYKYLQTALQNISKSTNDYTLKSSCNNSAKEAGNLAEQYAPKEKQQGEVTSFVSKEEEIAKKELDRLIEEKKKIDTKVVTTEAKVAVIKIDQEGEVKRAAALAEINNQIEAETTQQKFEVEAETKYKLKAIQGQGSSTTTVKAKDTPLKASAPPPPYEFIPTKFVSNDTVSNSNIYPDALKLEAELVAAEAAAKAAAAAAEALKTTLLEKVKEFFASGRADNIMEQIKVHCKNAIENGINVYETINDVNPLLVLASGFLSLNNLEKAEEICGKVARISQDAYNNIYDNKILSLLVKKYSELGNHNSCIGSCKKLNKVSEENAQFLKTIAEKITDTNKQCAIAILNVIEYQTETKDRKQQAEACLSKGKMQLFLGNKAEATRELNNAAIYNPSIYKNVDEETLKLMYEKTDSVAVKYHYLSKNCNLKLGDQVLAAKFREFAQELGHTGQYVQKALCEMKAFICSHEQAHSLTNSIACLGRSSPYYTNFSKISHNDLNQLDNYCLTVIGEIEGPM